MQKNLIIETDIFDDNNSNADDIKEDFEEKNGKNPELSTANLYLHAIVMMHKY